MNSIFRDILTWEGWNAINAISQILLSIAAFITINITLKQIGNGYRTRLYSEIIFNYEERKKKFGIMTTNLGMSYIFIKEACFFFYINKSKYRVTIKYDKKIIQPGETIQGYIADNVFEEILQNKNLHNQVTFRIETSAGKLIRRKVKFDMKSIQNL